MFVQIIQGKVGDAELLRRQSDRWGEELKPGAVGYLGSTRGVTPDGVAVFVARFESPEAARANSERPEQGAWWEQMAPAFDGEVTFHDCADVDLMFGGGSDMAGFVQIMQGKAVDPAAMRTAGRAMEDDLKAMRSDILGGIIAWHGDRDFTQVMYFTSEDDARKGESGMQDDAQAADWQAMLDGPISFLDLPDPEYD
jgi:hypothetical protein